MKQPVLLNRICTLFALFINLLLLPQMRGNAQHNGRQFYWPLGGPHNLTVPQSIYGGYGHYDEAINLSGASPVLFHQGLDLNAGRGTPVYAAYDGKVIFRKDTSAEYHNGILISIGVASDPPLPPPPHPGSPGPGTDQPGRSSGVLPGGGSPPQDPGTREALWYGHINPLPQFTEGATVDGGTLIGYIALPPPGMTAHLHFSWHYQPGTGPLDPMMRKYMRGNPIQLFSAQSRSQDIFKPVIHAIKYRTQLSERYYDARYFSERTSSTDVVVSEGTDIIARISEQFCNFDTNYMLSPTKATFRVQGYLPDSSRRLFLADPSIAFIDTFLAPYAPPFTILGENSEEKFFSSELVHTYYEDDETCLSIPRLAPSWIPNWYILTNVRYTRPKDGAADHAWYTKVRKDTLWNSPLRDAAHTADSNKNAEYPDGRYIVTVTAWGYGAANDTAYRKDTIFINNHDEFLYSCDSAGNLQDTFCIGKPVYIRGNGYPKNCRFDVYVFKPKNWIDRTRLNDVDDTKYVSRIVVQTNSNGEIIDSITLVPYTKLIESYRPSSSPVDSGYHIILDYDRDGYYTRRKQEHTVDVIDISPGIIGAQPLKVNSVQITASTCKNKCNGAVTFSVSGGKSEYTYWIGSKKRTLPIDSLCAGKHTITIKDSLGCSLDTAIVIPLDSVVVTTSFTAEPTGCTTCSGQATVIATGGTSPYTYVWPGGYSGSTQTGLCQGTYPVVVTDNNGCTDTSMVVVPNNGGMRLSYSGKSPTCKGKCDGTLSVHVSGGTPPYSHYWPGLPQYLAYSPGRSNVCSGKYLHIVTDAAGCRDSLWIEARDSLQPIVTCTGSDSARFLTGWVSSTASEGTPGYWHRWYSNSNIYGGWTQIAQGYGTTFTVGNLPRGWYMVMVTDSLGCQDSCLHIIHCIGCSIYGCTLCPIWKNISGNLPVNSLPPVDSVEKKSIPEKSGSQDLSISRVYPNPFNEWVNIDFYSSSGGEARVTIQNEIGATEKEIKVRVVKGFNTIQVNGKNLAKGIHFIRISKSGSVSTKVVRM